MRSIAQKSDLSAEPVTDWPHAPERLRADWPCAAERFRAEWAEHERKWPSPAEESIDTSSDPPGSWRGTSGRYLDNEANAQVDERCDRIAEAEREVISPAMREVEACDQSRDLAGFEYRLKSPDRIKDKVASAMADKGRTPQDALALIPDAIRYTFRYEPDTFGQGVRRDIARVGECGFELLKLKNLWDAEFYKGVNSQWLDPRSGERFEVQFHTRSSFEAKQLTHAAYERLRAGQADPTQEEELDSFQSRVSAAIPIPKAIDGIRDYPERY